jgi:hypothetical protein
MTRYKGRLSTRTIARDFPHIVEIAVPPGGLGKRLDDMHDRHRTRGIPSRSGGSRYAEPTWYTAWCFANADDADAFAAEFGGERLS